MLIIPRIDEGGNSTLCHATSLATHRQSRLPPAGHLGIERIGMVGSELLLLLLLLLLTSQL
jgi:hypothetical protein